MSRAGWICSQNSTHSPFSTLGLGAQGWIWLHHPSLLTQPHWVDVGGWAQAPIPPPHRSPRDEQGKHLAPRAINYLLTN